MTCRLDLIDNSCLKPLGDCKGLAQNYLWPGLRLTPVGSGWHQIRMRLWFLRDSSPVAMLVITDLSSCVQDVGSG